MISLQARSSVSGFKKFRGCWENLGSHQWLDLQCLRSVYRLVWASCVHSTLVQVCFPLLHPNRLWWTWAHQFSYVPWFLPARGCCSTRISPSLTWLCQLFLSGILRWVKGGFPARSAGNSLVDQCELAGARPVLVMIYRINVHVWTLFHYHFSISHSEFGLGDEDSWDDQERPAVWWENAKNLTQSRLAVKGWWVCESCLLMDPRKRYWGRRCII